MSNFIATGRCILSNDIEMIYGIRKVDKETYMGDPSPEEMFIKIDRTTNMLGKRVPSMCFIAGILKAAKRFYSSEFILNELKNAGIIKVI